MLGSLRLLLAAMVVCFHLAQGMAPVGHLGIFAVFGFYAISGYLITAILNDVYLFDFRRFWFNRVLRLFPIYYISAALSVLVIAVLPQPTRFHGSWNISAEFFDWLGNLLIFPFAFYDAGFRLVPSAWSVGVELVNYFLLWAVIARGPLLVLAAFLVAAAYHAWSILQGWSWTTRYVPFYAALLPFALGSLVYFARRHCFFPVVWAPRVFQLSGMLWVINLVVVGINSPWVQRWFDFFYYFNLLGLTGMIWALAVQPRPIAWRHDKLLGDLAYPVFLVHWPVGFAVASLFLAGRPRGVDLLVLSILPILALAYLLAYLAERFVEPLRDRVRLKENI
jgi:peptidoglycan/LPS O-acetylase OafA/YrhL